MKNPFKGFGSNNPFQHSGSSNKLIIVAGIVTFIIIIIVVMFESVVVVQAGPRGVVLYVGGLNSPLNLEATQKRNPLQ